MPPDNSSRPTPILPSTQAVPPARHPAAWASMSPVQQAHPYASSLAPTTPDLGHSQDDLPPSEPETIEPQSYWSTFLTLFKAIALLCGLLVGVPVALLGTFGAGPGTGIVPGLLDGVIAGVGFGIFFGVPCSLVMALRMKGTKITIPVRDSQAFLSRVAIRLGRMKYRQQTQESAYQVYVPGGLQLPLSYAKVFLLLKPNSATIVGPEPIVQKLLKALPPEV